MKANLFDVAAGRPDPPVADRLDLSFQLPKTPGDLRVQRIAVERAGIRAHLGGGALPFGTSKARAGGGR
ncbi:hypothetical protein [Streptomyces sp. NPDC001781]